MAKVEGKLVLPEGAKDLYGASESALNFPGPEPEVPEADITAEFDTDVLVLGGGHAGLQCALAAAEGGARVAVIESKPEERMTWLGEQVASFNSEFLTKLGFGNYDLDDIIDEYDRCGAFRTNHKVMARFVRNSGEMLDHLLSLIPADSDILDPDQYNIHQAYGNPSYPIVRGGYRTWASTIEFRGKVVTTRDVNYPVGKFSRLKDICAIVLRRTQELGAQWYFGHKLVKLTHSDDGRVDGAIVKSASGKLVRFRAAKGAVLCTGNFDSTGLKAGIWAGGHLDNTPMPPVQIRTSGDGARAFGQTAFLLLNAKGNRFVNESVAYALPAAMENQPGDFITMVTDANWLEQVRLAPVHHGCPDFGRPEYIEQVVEDMARVPGTGKEGYGVRSCSFSEREQLTMYAADTLEKLADLLGMTGKAKENWLASVERYNAMCDRKHDEDFGKDPITLLPVRKAPFYGCVTKLPKRDWTKRAPYLNDLGGLYTDENMNVLDADLEPIPGLYAAGNTLGGRFSVFYPTPCGGSYIGSAMTLGRLIGKELAAQ